MILTKRIGVGVVLVACLLAAWYSFVVLFQVPSYILPTPIDVANSFSSHSGVLLYATGVTVLEAACGLLAALAITGAFSVLFAMWPPMERCASPFLIGVQSIPILAIAPLLTLWFGVGIGSKMAASCLVCFFPLLSGWVSGMHALDPEEQDYFKTLGASRWQVARYLVLPRALPYFFAGLKVAAPLSVVGALSRRIRRRA